MIMKRYEIVKSMKKGVLGNNLGAIGESEREEKRFEGE